MGKLSHRVPTKAGVPFVLTALLIPLLAWGTSYLSIQPVGVPDDSLRLVEVVALATRQEIVSNRKEIYDPLLASGIPAEEIVDGSVGVGFVFCCGTHYANTSKNFFFIPKGMQIGPGDIVEIRSGRLRNGANPGAVNQATQVRQRKDQTDGSCRWDPPEQDSEQILYCDWMPTEGWTKERQGSAIAFPEVWIKPGQP